MPRNARVSLTAVAAFAAMVSGSTGTAVAAAGKPTAAFTVTPAKPIVGGKLVLDGRASKCSAKPCKFVWTGQSGRSKAVTLGRTSKSTLTLKRAETLTVTLKVTDKRRRSASKKRTIVVGAAPHPSPSFQPALPASPLITAPAPAPVATAIPAPTATATATATPTATPPPDTTAPETTIDGGPIGLTNVARATYTFSSEAGAAFECKVDNGAFAACTSPQALDLADGAHTFAVRARDAAGNVDLTPATRSLTVDTTAPETAIDSGPTGLTNVAKATYEFSSEAGASFECAVDNGAYAACTSPQAHDLADGAHTFAVRARDAAGNPDATAATRSLTVDTTAPETSIDSGPTGLTNAAKATYAFSSEPGASYECSLDDAPYAACTSPFSAELTDGAHSFAVRATDAAGNPDATPAARGLTVDTIAPEVSIDSGPSGEISDTSASFGFSSAEEGASFECRVDGPDGPGDFGACTSPWAVEGLKDGERTFHVRATDAAKNLGAAQTRSFTVKLLPPGAAVYVANEGDDAGDCTKAKPCRTFSRAYAAANDEGAVIFVTPGGYGDQVLPEGSKKLTVRATDDSRPTVRYLTARSNDVTLEGLRIEKLTIYGSRQTYDNVHVDGRFLRHPGIEHLLGDDNTFKNGRVGNITDEKGALIGPKRFTFENVVFHDVLVTDESVHNECLYATGAEGLTVRRSTFHACATMDLFVTNYTDGPEFGRITLENNIFEHSTMESADSWHFYSVGVHPVVGALRDWVVRNNTFELGVTVGPEVGSGRWVGNLGDWDCVPGVTYRFNVGNACGELDSGVFPAASTKLRPAAFGWLNPAAFDFRLGANSPALDNADAEDFPATDRNGAPRPNGFGPDAGALERVG